MEGLAVGIYKVSTPERPISMGDPDAPFKVAALDLGIKTNILSAILSDRGMYIKVFPFDTPFEDHASLWNPDGFFIVQRTRRSRSTAPCCASPR